MEVFFVAGAILVASVYWPGDGVVGRYNYATSSGQRYDAEAMRCAHKTLPLGTHLMLYRGNSNQDVIINDRGPYRKGRALDCTPAVDKALHLDGLGSVRVEPWPPLPRPKPDQLVIAEEGD